MSMGEKKHKALGHEFPFALFLWEILTALNL